MLQKQLQQLLQQQQAKENHFLHQFKELLSISKSNQVTQLKKVKSY